MIHVRRGKPPDVLRRQSDLELKRAHAFFRRPMEKRRQERFPFKVFRDASVRQALNELFHYKCAYCESYYGAVAPLDVEHFRPKERALGLDGTPAPDHYWWLATDWTNLLAACIDCNRTKGTRFPIAGTRAEPMAVETELRREQPLLLDPCRDRPEKHLVFSEDGLVQSSTPRGRTTIEVLGLNRIGLVQARHRSYRDLELQLRRSEELARLLDETSENDAVRAQVEAELAVVRGYLEPSKEYAGMHRQFVNRWLHDVGIDMFQPLVREASRKTVLVTAEEERETAAGFKQHRARQQSYSVEDEQTEQKEVFYAGAKRIESIEIENFKSIRRLRLAFPEPETAQEPWLMLLGENGTGKSSILQAVALALMGERHADELDLDASTFVRRDAGRSWGRIRVRLTNIPEPITVRFRRSSRRFVYETAEPKVLLLGYGATRLLRPPELLADEAPRHIRIKNLFDPRAPLDDVLTWLDDRDLVDDERFELVAAALKDLLMLDPDSRFVRDTDGIHALLGGKVAVPLQQLSDGFQSIVALCVDIMKSLLERWPSMEDAEGVVLLDELEAHLHPTWKIEIVGRLRRTFPRVAFLASTHDPLCLKGLQRGEIVLLEHDPVRRVIVQRNLPPIDDLRADQILTSMLFGLRSTRGDSGTGAIDRYAELLGKRGRGEADAEELDELAALRERLRPVLSEREGELERRVDTALRKVLVAREPSRAIASWTRPHTGPPSAEEVELQRRLADLLDPARLE